MKKKILNVVKLPSTMPILEQLYIEEFLFRKRKEENFLLLKSIDETKSSVKPSVVVGLSGKEDTLVYMDQCKTDGIQVLKRFTGGGTVLTDYNTFYVSFILNVKDTEGIKNAYPREIMKWTSDFIYSPAFGDEAFSLRENDYVIDDLKIGGNAQSISGNRFVHHTSFLYDFDDEMMMKYLKNPAKQPEYRENRNHDEFLDRLSNHLESPFLIFDNIECALGKIFELNTYENSINGEYEKSKIQILA